MKKKNIIRSIPWQAVMGIVLAAVMLVIWAVLAIGIFGSPSARS